MSIEDNRPNADLGLRLVRDVEEPPVCDVTISIGEVIPMPLWLRTKRALWQEDDATRGQSRESGHEDVDQAWLRLFGVSLADEVLVEECDCGDTFYRLYASGRIEVQAYDGSAISVSRVTAVLS